MHALIYTPMSLCLFVHNDASTGDPQSIWRASLNGHFVKLSTSEKTEEYCERISEDEYAQLFARYVQRVPKAASYARTMISLLAYEQH